MRKILASLLIPVSMWLSSCGFVDITINEDKVREFAIENITNEKMQEIEDKIAQYTNLDPEQIFVDISKNYNLDMTVEQAEKIAQEVCKSTSNSSPLGAIIMNILGVPITEQQVEELIGLAVGNYCPERSQ